MLIRAVSVIPTGILLIKVRGIGSYSMHKDEWA